MLLGTLGDSLLGNLLAGRMRAGEGSVRAGENFKFGSILSESWNTKILSKWA